MANVVAHFLAAMAISLVGGWLLSPLVYFLPFLALCMFMFHMHWAHGLVLALMWIPWLTLTLAMPLVLLFALVTLDVAALALITTLPLWVYCASTYVPLVYLSMRNPTQSTWFDVYFITVCWDPPLLLLVRALSKTGQRLLTPLATIVDDHVVIGSLPLPEDVATLAAAPYNVRYVINMCQEYAGPVKEYDVQGIKQFRVPVRDMHAPTVAQLEYVLSVCKQLLQGRVVAEQAKKLLEKGNAAAVVGKKEEQHAQDQKQEPGEQEQEQTKTVESGKRNSDNNNNNNNNNAIFNDEKLNLTLNEGNRIFIHCKGGRGRAACATLSYLVGLRGMELRQAAAMLKEKRKVVSVRVLGYDSVKTFSKKYSTVG